MSTRALVGIMNSKGEIYSIYNHYDGYPEGLGKTLTHYYKHIKKIRNLIKLGDASFIGTSLEPSPLVQRYGFDFMANEVYKNLPESQRNTLLDDHSGNPRYSVFYTRDRGEKTPAIKYKNLDKFLDEQFIDFKYVFKDREWYAYDSSGKAIHPETGEPVKDKLKDKLKQDNKNKVTAKYTREQAKKDSKVIKNAITTASEMELNNTLVFLIVTQTQAKVVLSTKTPEIKQPHTKGIIDLTTFTSHKNTKKARPLKEIEDIIYYGMQEDISRTQ